MQVGRRKEVPCTYASVIVIATAISATWRRAEHDPLRKRIQCLVTDLNVGAAFILPKH